MIRYWITDRSAVGGVDGLLAVAHRVMDRVDWVQVREKDLGGRALLDLVEQMIELGRSRGVRVLVNDRVDVALAAGADGVHLTSVGVSPEVVRQIVPSGFRIGVSCHTLRDLQRAKAEGADYALLSPVLASPGKGPALGWERFGEMTGQVRLPVLALGGVGWREFEEARQAGAAGVAGIRLFQELDGLR